MRTQSNSALGHKNVTLVTDDGELFEKLFGCMKILVNFEEKIQAEEKQRRYKFVANQFLRTREQSLTNQINIAELKQRLVLEEALTPKENFRKSTKKRFRFDFSIKLTDPPVTVRPIRGRAYEFPDQTGPGILCLTPNILQTRCRLSIL